MIAARADLRVQDDVLARVKPMTESDGADCAILYDRAALARQQPQRYGIPRRSRTVRTSMRGEVGLPPPYVSRAELLLARAPN